MTLKDTSPQRNILLTHGVTYSSHEFDVDYNEFQKRLIAFLNN